MVVRVICNEACSLIKSERVIIESPLNFEGANVIVLASWGRNVLRDKVALQCLVHNIPLLSEFYFLYLDLSDGQFLEAPNDKRFCHVKIQKNIFSEGLWQKEALFNLGLKIASNSKNIVFMDNDVLISDPFWQDEVLRKCDVFDFVQGFKRVVDTEDSSYDQFSWTYLRSISCYEQGAPGLIWCGNTKNFLEIEGHNKYMIDGSGDGAFVCELVGLKNSYVKVTYNWFISKIRVFKNKYSYGFIDSIVKHVNHGPARDYSNRMFFVDAIIPSVHTYISYDELDLPFWSKKFELFNSLGNIFSKIVSNPKGYLNYLGQLSEVGLVSIPHIQFWNNGVFVKYPSEIQLDLIRDEESLIDVLNMSSKDGSLVREIHYSIEISKLKDVENTVVLVSSSSAFDLISSIASGRKTHIESCNVVACNALGTIAIALSQLTARMSTDGGSFFIIFRVSVSSTDSIEIKYVTNDALVELDQYSLPDYDVDYSLFNKVSLRKLNGCKYKFENKFSSKYLHADSLNVWNTNQIPRQGQKVQYGLDISNFENPKRLILSVVGSTKFTFYCSLWSNDFENGGCEEAIFSFVSSDSYLINLAKFENVIDACGKGRSLKFFIDIDISEIQHIELLFSFCDSSKEEFLSLSENDTFFWKKMIEQSEFQLPQMNFKSNNNQSLFRTDLENSCLSWHLDQYLKVNNEQSELYVVIAIFNLNESRVKSLLAALRKLSNQNGNWKLIVSELVVGQESMLELNEFHNLHSHIKVHGGFENLNIWQKEALQNLAVKSLSEDSNLLFIDSDIFCNNPNWFLKTSRLLNLFPDFLIQPFSDYEDTVEKSLNFSSMFYADFFGENNYVASGAGTAWAMKKSMHTRINGFPYMSPDGSNDTLFSAEILGEKFFEEVKYKGANWPHQTRRYPGKIKFSSFRETIHHINHGNTRLYSDRKSLMSLLPADYSLEYGLNSEGILQWRNKTSLTRKIVTVVLKGLNSIDRSDLNETILAILRESSNTTENLKYDLADKATLEGVGGTFFYPWLISEKSYEIIHLSGNNEIKFFYIFSPVFKPGIYKLRIEFKVSFLAKEGDAVSATVFCPEWSHIKNCIISVVDGNVIYEDYFSVPVLSVMFFFGNREIHRSRLELLDSQIQKVDEMICDTPQLKVVDTFVTEGVKFAVTGNSNFIVKKLSINEIQVSCRSVGELSSYIELNLCTFIKDFTAAEGHCFDIKISFDAESCFKVLVVELFDENFQFVGDCEAICSGNELCIKGVINSRTRFLKINLNERVLSLNKIKFDYFRII